MSFDPRIKALEENPALAEELGTAKTPRERDAILDAHGIEKPGADSQIPEAGGAPRVFLTIDGICMIDNQARSGACLTWPLW